MIRQDPLVTVAEIDGLDLIEHLPEELWGECAAAKHLVTFSATGGNCGLKDDRGYTPVHAATMRRAFKSNATYVRVVRALLDAGVLECDNHYIKGEKCKGYRLGPDWAGRRIRMAGIVDERLAKKLRASRPASLPGAVHVWLSECLRRARVSRDYVSVCTKKNKVGQSLAVQTLELEAARPVVDFFGGRFHSPFCQLGRSVRKFVTLDGEPVVGLDVRNSQPLVVGLAAASWYAHGERHVRWHSFERIGGYGGRGRRPNVYADGERYLSSLVGRLNTGGGFEPAAGPPDAPPPIAIPADLDAYLNTCCDGRWYETLAGYADWNRPAAKLQYLRYLYSEHRSTDRDTTRVRHAMADYHPAVDGYIRAAKRKHGARGFCRIIQRTESTLMIGRVARSLMEADRDRPVLTLHDAIYCKPADIDDVRETVENVYGQYGVKPALHVELP